MEIIVLILSVLAALGAGFGIGAYFRSRNVGSKVQEAQSAAQRITQEAEERHRKTLLEAREEAIKIRATGEAEIKELRQELQRTERRLLQREEQMERRVDQMERRERQLATKEQELDRTRTELEEIKGKQLQQLERVAGITLTEAREQIMTRAEDEMRHELAKRYRELEQQHREDADQKAREVVTLAIHRLATDVVSESTTSSVPLPNDEMKGRLIGREGRNIRALEAATGVDIIIDDTPEVVTISCFDPIRREIARLAMTKLVADGRIHPARIEEIVEKAQKEVEDVIHKAGEQAVFEAGVRGLHPEIVKLLGRLKFRFSYGENQLKHAIEVSLIAGMMAAEIGANVEIAKAGGLLHDIGKALTHEVEGSHATIGADITKKYGIHSEVAKIIGESHDDEKGSLEGFLVTAADAVSAARPGARKETLDHYVKRLEALEQVATSFPGVEKVYAIQAGREVRVIVKPEHVDDVAAATMARDMAKKIEENLVYPGQIKVMIVRESRSVEYAR